MPAACLARGWWPGGNLVTGHQDGSEQSPPVVSPPGEAAGKTQPHPSGDPHPTNESDEAPCRCVREGGCWTQRQFPSVTLGARPLIYSTSCSSPLSKVLGPNCPGLPALLLPRSSSFISLCLSFFTCKMERKILPQILKGHFEV